jgi:hypothetical protein
LEISSMDTNLASLKVLAAHIDGLKRTSGRIGAPLHLRVAARSLDQALVNQLDMTARLQVLEGVAGVPEGKWSNGRPIVGLIAARRYFTDGNMIIPEEWFLKGDAHLYKTAAFHFQRFLAKIPSVTPEGTKVKRMFYAIGEFLKPRILAGKATVMEAAKRAAEFVRRRAMGVLRGLATQKRSGPGGYGEWNVTKGLKTQVEWEETDRTGRTDIATYEGLGAEDQQGILARMMSDPHDPDMAKVRTSLLKGLLARAKSETTQNVIRELLDSVSDSGIPKGRIRIEVATRTGVTPQYVGKVEDWIMKTAPMVVASNPALKKLIDNILSRSEIEAMTSGFEKSSKKISLAQQQILDAEPVPF